jgi:hypothetical protein
MNSTIVQVLIYPNCKKLSQSSKMVKKGQIRRRASFKKAYVTLDKPITQLAKLHLSKD